MLVSLLARRFALVAVPAVATRPVVARRTLFATPQLNAKASEKKAARKTEATTPAKRGRPPKTQEKQPKQEKKKVRIASDLKPPKRAPGPYILFYSSFLKSHPKAGTLQDYQELSKRAGEIWRGYSMAEKKPFYDESEVRKVQATQKRADYFRNTPPSVLKQLNATRKAQGKCKIHSVNKHTKPASPFLLFSQQFRNSPEGQAIINDASSEKNHNIRVALAAGERWRSMSGGEKAPYSEMFKKEKEIFKAEQTQS